ncbi:hypothetical protein F4780DRAFT_689460 [Xylariomycetidae sp. FL0641]|nr:hypothetical protein F4780DRAFT_689460 [Xylariomycetidae sp. FL0641]
MSILDARDALTFPALAFPPGDNNTDTLLYGVHFNLTTLRHFNYTLYSNNTLSNWTKCYLIDQPWTPTTMLTNGTFINSTWCYMATLPSGPRSHIGIGLAVVFGLSLIAALVNLTRHGKLYLPAEKRFYPIGRRWQWYWAVFVCATALIGLFTNIDVDRYRVVELPLILNVFFWYLMQWGTVAMVWEAARHWGSWMERQYIDPNPFLLPQSDRRWQFEFWLPIWFYGWLWLNFFLLVPRNWGAIEYQRSEAQTIAKAIPASTDGRFKAAALILVVCWATIVVSLWHSIRHYEARNRGWFNRLLGLIRYMPIRFMFMLPVLLGMIGYQALSAWVFDLSPKKADTNLIAMYVGGYAPSLLLLFIQNAAGLMRKNEDKQLIRQRRERGNALDQELGLVKKPAWWRRVNGHVPTGNMADRIMQNVSEVGGGRATGRQVERMVHTRADEAEAAAENGSNLTGTGQLGRTASIATSTRTDSAPPPYDPVGAGTRRGGDRTVQAAAGLLFPNASPAAATTERGRGLGAPNQQCSRPNPNERSASNASGLSTSGPPQQVRSMLDV